MLIILKDIPKLNLPPPGPPFPNRGPRAGGFCFLVSFLIISIPSAYEEKAHRLRHRVPIRLCVRISRSALATVRTLVVPNSTAYIDTGGVATEHIRGLRKLRTYYAVYAVITQITDSQP